MIVKNHYYIILLLYYIQYVKIISDELNLMQYFLNIIIIAINIFRYIIDIHNHLYIFLQILVTNQYLINICAVIFKTILRTKCFVWIIIIIQRLRMNVILCFAYLCRILIVIVVTVHHGWRLWYNACLNVTWRSLIIHYPFTWATYKMNISLHRSITDFPTCTTINSHNPSNNRTDRLTLLKFVAKFREKIVMW